MSPVEIVVLVAAVLVCGALLLGLARGGDAGAMSVRGRLRGRSERDSIELDREVESYAPQGGHHHEPPGLRKPPNEGGLL